MKHFKKGLLALSLIFIGFAAQAQQSIVNNTNSIWEVWLTAWSGSSSCSAVVDYYYVPANTTLNNLSPSSGTAPYNDAEVSIVGGSVSGQCTESSAYLNYINPTCGSGVQEPLVTGGFAMEWPTWLVFEIN